MATISYSRQATPDEMAAEIDRRGRVIEELEAKVATTIDDLMAANRRAADDAEHFIQAAVDGAPEPLRRLGEWLANIPPSQAGKGSHVMSANPRDLAKLRAMATDPADPRTMLVMFKSRHGAAEMQLIIDAFNAANAAPGNDAGAVTSLPGEEWIAALFKHHHRSACYPECSDEEAHTFARAVLARLSPNRVDDKIEASAGGKSAEQALRAIIAGLPESDPGPAFEPLSGWVSHGNYDDVASDAVAAAMWALKARLEEVLALLASAGSKCECRACSTGTVHASDCAVHNPPALPEGVCDCSAGETAPDPVAADGIVGRLREHVTSVILVIGTDDDDDVRMFQQAADLIEHLQAQLASAKAAGRREGLEVDALWEALKRECCSTRPDSPNWSKVVTIVTVRRANLAAAIRSLAETDNG